MGPVNAVLTPEGGRTTAVSCSPAALGWDVSSAVLTPGAGRRRHHSILSDTNPERAPPRLECTPRPHAAAGTAEPASGILAAIMADSAEPTARAVVEPIDLAAPIESVVARFAGQLNPAILESSLQNDAYGRFSIFACDPVAELRVDHGCVDCPLDLLARGMAKFPRTEPHPSQVPFAGGWIGFLSYEAGLWIERIGFPVDATNVHPLVRFCLYDSAAVYDHLAKQWYLTAIEWPEGGGMRRRPVGERLKRVKRMLEAARDDDPPRPPDYSPGTALSPNMSREDYITRVDRIKRYIEAGDVYQVNLTQRFTTRTTLSPVELYLRLRRISPSSHAALLSWDHSAVVCSSPELFLDLHDALVITRPIKGTRGRDDDPQRDASLRRALETSEKDRAELNMIVDLLRNDLGRVCSFGTVRVVEAGEIEDHPTVFHRVATVEGRLRANLTWVDLLRAAFPGGSITGAPKVRAMQIIKELEPTPRGIYCGSVGWIGLDGSTSLNIAIRTMTQTGDRVHAYAGGAIVADSTPESEYEEVLTKLAGMARALGCRLPKEAPHLLLEEVPAI